MAAARLELLATAAAAAARSAAAARAALAAATGCSPMAFFVFFLRELPLPTYAPSALFSCQFRQRLRDAALALLRRSSSFEVAAEA